MFRSLFALINYILWTGLLGTAAILVSPFDARGILISKITRLWAFLILKASGIPYRVSGLDRLDLDKHYLFIANHESAFDIPLVFAALPYQLVSVAKIELKKTPFLGWAMARAKHIFIDRQNYRSAIKSLRKAAESLQKYPRSVLVFPEGERSNDGKIHSFRRGGVNLAFEVGMPVVPMAVCGTGNILGPKSLKLKKGKIELRIGAPIETGFFADMGRSELADYLRNRVMVLRNSWVSEHGQSAGVTPA